MTAVAPAQLTAPATPPHQTVGCEGGPRTQARPSAPRPRKPRLGPSAMLGLMVQNFVSAVTGVAVLPALIREPATHFNDVLTSSAPVLITAQGRVRPRCGREK